MMDPKQTIRRGFVGVALLALTALLFVPTGWAQTRAPAKTTFSLFPNQPFVACLAAPHGGTPIVRATVERGELNDKLTLQLSHFKPGLQFDLFTVQRSPQRADGTADPQFHNFGLAWYQSDVQVDGNGAGNVTINTILLDQIFGFDPDVSLAPTNTFHVGFWFNDPNDAAPCGFDTTKPTPFNGEHHAGPLAFISRPDSTTGLGPLCTQPSSTSPSGCNP